MFEMVPNVEDKPMERKIKGCKFLLLKIKMPSVRFLIQPWPSDVYYHFEDLLVSIK